LQETKITASQFVKARENSTKMLDFADKTLNQMPLPIPPRVVFTRLFGILFGRNDGFNPVGDEFIDKRLRPIAAGDKNIRKSFGKLV
jgi:hypothetical protein